MDFGAFIASDNVLFYGSAAGLLASVALWPYLYRRYTSSGSAAPVRAIDRGFANEPVPVIPRPSPSEAPSAAAKETPAQKLSADAASAGPNKAVIYLQGLKANLEHLEKEVLTLKQQVSGFSQKHESQFQSLLQSLGELKEEMHQLPHEISAPAAVKEVLDASKTHPSGIQPVVETPKKDETIRIVPVPTQPIQESLAAPPAKEPEEPPKAASAPVQAPSGIEPSSVPPPSSAPAPAEAEDKPQRRGPVWPV